MPEWNVYRYTEIVGGTDVRPDDKLAGASFWDLMAKVTADSDQEAMAILAAQDATVENLGQTGHYAACRASCWVTQDFTFKTIAEAIPNETGERRTIEIGSTT